MAYHPRHDDGGQPANTNHDPNHLRSFEPAASRHLECFPQSPTDAEFNYSDWVHDRDSSRSPQTNEGDVVLDPGGPFMDASDIIPNLGTVTDPNLNLSQSEMNEIPALASDGFYTAQYLETHIPDQPQMSSNFLAQQLDETFLAMVNHASQPEFSTFETELYFNSLEIPYTGEPALLEHMEQHLPLPAQNYTQEVPHSIDGHCNMPQTDELSSNMVSQYSGTLINLFPEIFTAQSPSDHSGVSNVRKARKCLRCRTDPGKRTKCRGSPICTCCQADIIPASEESPTPAVPSFDPDLWSDMTNELVAIAAKHQTLYEMAVREPIMDRAICLELTFDDLYLNPGLRESSLICLLPSVASRKVNHAYPGSMLEKIPATCMVQLDHFIRNRFWGKSFYEFGQNVSDIERGLLEATTDLCGYLWLLHNLTTTRIHTEVMVEEAMSRYVAADYVAALVFRASSLWRTFSRSCSGWQASNFNDIEFTRVSHSLEAVYLMLNAVVISPWQSRIGQLSDPFARLGEMLQNIVRSARRQISLFECLCASSYQRRSQKLPPIVTFLNSFKVFTVLSESSDGRHRPLDECTAPLKHVRIAVHRQRGLAHWRLNTFTLLNPYLPTISVVDILMHSSNKFLVRSVQLDHQEFCRYYVTRFDRKVKVFDNLDKYVRDPDITDKACDRKNWSSEPSAKNAKLRKMAMVVHEDARSSTRDDNHGNDLSHDEEHSTASDEIEFLLQHMELGMQFTNESYVTLDNIFRISDESSALIDDLSEITDEPSESASSSRRTGKKRALDQQDPWDDEESTPLKRARTTSNENGTTS